MSSFEERVSPAQRIRVEMAELIADTTTGSRADKFEEVARLAVRLALQSAMEARIAEFLGRDRYARGDRTAPVPQRLQPDSDQVPPGR